tara:strand:+ start:16529 stop:16645 length:117 start_codon:yes stop_codon:yes gene_type:complete
MASSSVMIPTGTQARAAMEAMTAKTVSAAVTESAAAWS